MPHKRALARHTSSGLKGAYDGKPCIIVGTGESGAGQKVPTSTHTWYSSQIDGRGRLPVRSPLAKNLWTRTDEPSQYDALYETVLEIDDKAQVLFDYFLVKRDWQAFFALYAEQSQLARLDKIVALSNWLLEHPEHSRMEREAKNF